ncbi:MAG: sigma-54-dependent transcriptional regulator [Candidatus Sumerlaeia bacterium]
MSPAILSENPILLVDDEEPILMACSRMIEAAKVAECIPCEDSRNVLDLLSQRPFGAVLLDLFMPYITGIDLIPKIHEEYPHLPIIALTGLNDVETAVQCMQAGAFDYLVKPVKRSRLISTLEKALMLHEVESEYSAFKRRVMSGELENPEAFQDIITCDPKMQAIFKYLETVAPTNRCIMISGETGVGKDMLAKAIHQLSGRVGEMVALNSAGVDDHFFADTLFGHMRGSFTGADMARQGLVEKAGEGTLFLDEIGDLSGPSQVKLLRLLQENEYLPLGSDQVRQARCRIVVATNRRMEELRTSGKFRQDLLFRLRTHYLEVPPLRERPEDVPLLLDHFLGKAAEELGKKKPTPPRELCQLLQAYHFPGNVRELEAMTYDAVAQHTSRKLSTSCFREHIERHGFSSYLPENQQEEGENGENGSSPFASWEVLPFLKDVGPMLIVEAMRRSHMNQSVAAQLLGITRSGLNKALKRYEISLDEIGEVKVVNDSQ